MPDNKNLPDDYYDDDVPFKLPLRHDDDDERQLARRDDQRAVDADHERELADRDAVDPDAPTRHENVITGDYEILDDNGLPKHTSPKLPISGAARDEEDTDEINIPQGDDLRDILRGKKFMTGADVDDSDVPFDLPNHDGRETEESGRIINKMNTMPHEPGRTLPGSGGLDPNPDFDNYRRAEPTMKNAAVRPDDVRYQRPNSAPTIQQQRVPNYNPATPAPPAQGNPGMMGANPPRRLPKKRRRTRFQPGCVAIALGLFLTFCGGLTLVSLLVGGVAYARVGDLINEQLASLDDYTNFQSTFIYDRNGTQLYEVFNEGRRTNVRLDNIPQDLINATIAIEDDEFYTNIGIDIPATTVALLQFVGASPDENTPGGSTITQQLVRNVLFTPEYAAERSATRKAEEIVLAIALTGRYSKDDILEMYLNEIYYGNLAYGAQAASQILFGKSVSELTLGEAALLAGLPQAPAELDPLNPDPNVQAAVDRRWRQVLNEMVEEGYITPEQRDEALRQGLNFVESDVPLRAPHFTVYAQDALERVLTGLGFSPERIASGGFQVYTTIDLRINDMTQNAVRQQVDRLRPTNNVGNGAVVVLKPVTGEIIAMVGSADYNNDAIDGRVNVTTALRQPGSTVKLFTYSAALERGMTPGDVIWDTRSSIGIPGQPTYEPVNYDRSFHGPMTVRRALANSYNVPAVQTLRNNVGVDYLLNFFQRLGMTSVPNDPSRFGLSLTLGGAEVAPIELTAAFASYGNEGVLVEPQAILCILDNDDNILYQYEDSCPKGNQTPETINAYAQARRVLDPRIAYIMNDVLSDNDARTPAMGSGSQLVTPGINTAVKTGTTDNFKDNWTVGYTRNVAVGVWVGNSNGDPMVNTSGLSGAAPIWNQVITAIYNDNSMLSEFAHNGQLVNDQFFPPQGLEQRRICDVRSLTDPAPQCPREASEWFLTGPAGIPNADGVLEYPNVGIPQPTQQSNVQLASPGVYRALVQPLDAGVAQAIRFDVPPGQIAPPAPLYCRVTPEQVSIAPGVREQLFIAPPPTKSDAPSDAAHAENYARGIGLAFLPTIDCTPELLAGGGFGPGGVTAFISSPSPGQTIPNSGVDINGTVQFNEGQVGFWILEIRGGQYPNWTPIDDQRFSSVVNGRLGFLAGAPALQPGSYELRLMVMGIDYQTPVQAPLIVPFTIP